MYLLTITFLDDDYSRLDSNTNQQFIKSAEKCSNVKIMHFDNGDSSTRFERYKMAVESSDSEYILFANHSIDFTDNNFTDIINILEKNKKSVMTFREKVGPSIEKSLFVLDKICYLSRYVFKVDFLKSIDITEKQQEYWEDILFLNIARLKTVFCAGAKITIENDEFSERNIPKYIHAFQKSWYINRVRDILIPFLNNGCSINQQKMVLYMIWLVFSCNRSVFDKRQLNEDELILFNSLVDEALNKIDIKVFFSKDMVRKIGAIYCDYFYSRTSYPTVKVRIVKGKNGYVYKINEKTTIKDFIKCGIYCININNDFLEIDYSLNFNSPEILKQLSIKAYGNGEALSQEETGIIRPTKCFGEEIAAESIYHINVDLKGRKLTSITFHAVADDINTTIPIIYKGVASRLNTNMKYSYCDLNGYNLSHIDDALIVKKGTHSVLTEIKYQGELREERKARPELEQVIQLRKKYLLQKNHKKQIWIFYDKLYKAGDNGEFLFEYAFNNIKNVDPYYIVTEESKDYKRLVSQYGENILVFGSVRQQLYALKADIIFATHMDAFKYCGLDNNMQKYCRGELTAKIVCIQHGLTIQDMPQNQNRVRDNTQAYFCASQMEIDNLMQSSYGYYTTQLHLTGLPRYDGLKSVCKKQILIAPTWRRDIVISGNQIGTSKEYNPDFKKTVYYHIYEDLIHNEKLSKTAEKNGYKIVFLLHPTIGVQKDDFTGNKTVSIVSGTNASYDDYLSESDLMVTDYSGIQFDFAYMKKPVVYYHPKELPPQYDNSRFTYEKDGFGPLFDEHDALVDYICNQIELGCVMEPCYIERVDKFFRYTDRSNRKRICDVIEKSFPSRA